MNDIEKLHQVIDSLEEQSSRVTEFNGVLTAVNSARAKIESTKLELSTLIDEQKVLTNMNNNYFSLYGLRLTELKSEVTSIEDTQKKMINTITKLNFVTREQHDQRCSNIEKTIQEQFQALEKKIEADSKNQQSSIKTLKILLFLELLIIVTGIMFLAKNAIN